MKRSLVVVVLNLAVLCGMPARSEPLAEASFSKLKSLAGEWRGKTPKGREVRLSYQVIAGGTTVMEVFRYHGDDANAMYTLYHLDGDKLMLTHYCVSNNQPRMRAVFPSGEPDTLRFTFLDATNLANTNDGHMRQAVLRFIDADHIANEWTYSQGGKNVFVEGARYERVK